MHEQAVLLIHTYNSAFLCIQKSYRTDILIHAVARAKLPIYGTSCV